jgi:uncharacterized protein (TIGR02145 family)
MTWKNIIWLILFLLLSCSKEKQKIQTESKAMEITFINPAVAKVGEIITISGSGFGNSRGSSSVTFNNTAVNEYKSWNNSELKVIIPAGASTGKIWITVDGIKSNDWYLTVYNQEWSKENLDVDHYRNGDKIPEVKDSIQWERIKTGAWCYYKNNPANGKIYGKLYNWFAVNDKRGLAPEGWHIPKDSEWQLFIDYLGGSSSAISKLKDSGKKYWDSGYGGGTNESGFGCLPGGARTENGRFGGIGVICLYWTSTSNEVDAAKARLISHNENGVINDNGYKNNGSSVRCIKDN